jgi:hypothetical protein
MSNKKSTKASMRAEIVKATSRMTTIGAQATTPNQPKKAWAKLGIR